MKLNTITTGMWKTIANYLNYNFNKLSIAADRLKDSGNSENSAFKGVFSTEAILKNSYPDPEPGEYAFVLVDGPGQEDLFKVYSAETGGIWTAQEGTYDPEVILTDYVRMIRLSSISDLSGDIRDYLRNYGNT